MNAEIHAIISDKRRRAEALVEECRDVHERAEREHRGLSKGEQAAWDARMGEVRRLNEEIEAELSKSAGTKAARSDLVLGADVEPLRPAGRSYRGLFRGDQRASLSTDGWRSFKDYVEAVASNRAHPQLRTMAEGVPSTGGFIIPEQFAADIFDAALENEIVRPRATVHAMRHATLKVPATVIGDHSSDGLYGGVTAQWTAEEGTFTVTEPTFRQMTLVARKLGCFAAVTSELGEDAVAPAAHLQAIFAKALEFYMDKAFLKGTGAGQPLGVLNASCLIAVAKETGQSADTIVYENLVNMLARLAPGSYNQSVWVCHVSTIPQLLTLTLSVGTGGEHIRVLSETGGRWTMLGRPVVFTEKVEVLGDQGDILLADFTQYIIGLRAELRLESSIGPYFTTDRTAWRAVARVDGQPAWDEAMTLEDGTTTVSPFVALAERA